MGGCAEYGLEIEDMVWWWWSRRKPARVSSTDANVNASKRDHVERVRHYAGQLLQNAAIFSGTYVYMLHFCVYCIYNDMQYLARGRIRT